MNKENQPMPGSFEPPVPHLEDYVDNFPNLNSTRDLWLWIFSGVLLASFGLYLTVSRLIYTFTAVNQHGRSILLNPATGFVLIGIFLLGLGIWVCYIGIKHRNDGITLWKNGFSIRNDKQIEVWYWREITRLDTWITNVKFGDSLMDARIKLLLEKQDGTSRTFRNRYERMTELIDQIRRQVLPILYHKAQNRLAQHKHIDFGEDLRVVESGIELEQGHFSWNKINEPVISNGVLKLFTMSDHTLIYRARIQQIQNLDVLVHLIKNPPVSD